MGIKWLFVISSAGILIGLASIFVYNEKVKTQPPVAVSYNPYEAGVYATGIVEAYQSSGSNDAIYPEVSGKVIEVFVKEGDLVKKDSPLLAIDDTVQKKIVDKDVAQVHFASENLVNTKQQSEKTENSYKLNPASVSKNALDMAVSAIKIATENLNVALEQEKADRALWEKYVIKAPIDGVILRLMATTGSYVSPQGSYDTYTQSMLPTIQMQTVSSYLQVRCYLDEILVPRLPDPKKLSATMFIRGLNNRGIPLEFVNIEPVTIPNIQLSAERNQRVDVRVLPIIFKFVKPMDINIFPGQLVDVYIKTKK